MRDNDPGAIYWIDLRDSEFVDALRRGKIAWSQLNPALTHHLSFKNARLFADRYSQILALVVQESDSGQAIGCLTLEASADAAAELRFNGALHAELQSTVDLLAPLLARW